MPVEGWFILAVYDDLVMSMIGIIGGGMLGCCTALELAARGERVVLIEAAPELLRGSAHANEGKLHFGHVYPRDRSLATARLMLRGALAFAPALRRWLGDAAVARIGRGPGFRYALHRDSLSTPDEVRAHFQAIPDLAREVLGGARVDCLGADPLAPPRRLPLDGCEPAMVQALFGTDEINLDNRLIGDLLRAAVAAEPRIETLTSTRATGARLDADSVVVTLDGHGERRFDHVINASWGSRLALDAAVGLAPPAKWLFRLKYLVRVRGSGLRFPATTVTVGPFGDVAPTGDELALSWYPAGRLASSSALAAPADWPTHLEGEPARALGRAMVDGLGALFPAILALHGTQALATAEVSGGIIYALGGSDVDDPASGLHDRHALGRRSLGRWHSVDPGKWTTCPLFAMEVAEHVAPRARQEARSAA